MLYNIKHFLSGVIILKLLVTTTSVVAAPIYPKVGSTLVYNCTGAFTGERKHRIIDVHNGKIFTITTGNPSTPIITKRFLWQFFLPSIFELSVLKTSVRSQKVTSGDIDKLDYTQAGKTYRGVIEQVGVTSSDNEKIEIEAIVGNKASHRMPDGGEFFGHLITINRVSDNRPRMEQTIVVSSETGNTVHAFTKTHGENVAGSTCVLNAN
jgi:hypothetical protein